MVMKDKLVKTNHKAGYYLAKQIGIVLLGVFSLGFVIAVPTYISTNSKKKATAIAEENITEVTEDKDSGESVEYESYND